MKYQAWPTESLGSWMRFLSGGTPSKSEARYWGGEIPWVSSAEMTEERIYETTHNVTVDGANNGTRLVPKNTVLIVVRGMSLAKECRVSVTTKESTFNQDIKALDLAPEIDPRFIFYYLRSQKLALRDAASEAAHGTKKLDMAVLEQWPLPVIPLPTQRKIAAILTAYDDLIETNKRRIALLEKMAEELYREWFVRMRFPGHQNTRFVKGVPEGWEIKRLGEILELAYGKALKESEREPGEFLVYGSGGIVGTHSKALVKNEGIIVGRKGNVGAVYFSNRGFFPIDTVFYVVSELPLTFLFFLLRSMNFINNDAAVPGLNRNQAYSNQLLYPGRELITKFAETADPIFDMKNQLQIQNENLTKTRDLLLPRLISGKLSVENLDIQFPPSMQEETPEPESAYAELHL